MILALLIELIITGFFCLIAKLNLSYKIYDFSVNLMKQGFVTLIIFNSFNISFSAGVHWKYANKYDNLYVLSSVIMAITIAAIVFIIFAM